MLYIEFHINQIKIADIRGEWKKTGLKLNIQKTKIMASAPINFTTNRRGKSGNWHFIFLSSKITVDSNCSLEIKRHFAP